MKNFKPVVEFKPAPAKIAGPTVVIPVRRHLAGELDVTVVGKTINPERHRERLAMLADRAKFCPR